MTAQPAVHVGSSGVRDPFAGVEVPEFLRGREHPACADHDPEMWFTFGSGPRNARHTAIAVRVCHACPLLVGCRQWGLDNNEHGIWGGLTEHKRTRIRNRAAKSRQYTARRVTT